METRKMKKLWGIMLLIAVLSLCTACGDEDYFAYSDNMGDDVPVIVTGVSYAPAFYTGFMDISLDIENTTETDYRDMTFVALAWDSDGFPIEFDYTDDPYPYLMSCNNLASNGTDSHTWQHAEYYEIEYMSVFLADCTDFEGYTWVNPAMEYINEHKGEKLDTTQLSYFIFSNPSTEVESENIEDENIIYFDDVNELLANSSEYIGDTVSFEGWTDVEVYSDGNRIYYIANGSEPIYLYGITNAEGESLYGGYCLFTGVFDQDRNGQYYIYVEMMG